MIVVLFSASDVVIVVVLLSCFIFDYDALGNAGPDVSNILFVVVVIIISHARYDDGHEMQYII